MNPQLQNLVRRMIPRTLRNWLRSPRKTLCWAFNQLRGPVDYAVRPDWTIRCPKNAADSAFYLQLDDPPQVQEFDDFARLIRQQKKVVLLDIGCHFGIFCFAAAHYGGKTARALAVDPSTEARVMVERIAQMNLVQDQVRFVQAAVGAAVGELEMVETGLTAAGYVVLPKDHPRSERTCVPLTTVDELVKPLVELPSVIKVDVESYELEVLRGGRNTFAQNSIPLFLEMHNQMMRDRGVEPESVVQLLREYGYVDYRIGDRELSGVDMIKPDIVRLLATKRQNPPGH